MKELRFDADDGVCALLLLLTPSARLSFWSRAINQPAVKSVFIGTYLAKADNGSTAIWRSKSKGELAMKTLNQKMKSIGSARRKKVEARAAGLIAEEMTLQELRRARKVYLERTARVGSYT